jgi:hypothetical protein
MFVKFTLVEKGKELKILANANLIDYVVDNDDKEKDTCILMLTTGMKGIVKGSYDDICRQVISATKQKLPIAK